jgi:hypothetical protein
MLNHRRLQAMRRATKASSMWHQSADKQASTPARSTAQALALTNRMARWQRLTTTLPGRREPRIGFAEMATQGVKGALWANALERSRNHPPSFIA